MGTLVLVRHGQASFGAADYDVLSDVGWEQGRALGRHLATAGLAPTDVVRGGMRRHRETWEAMADGAGWSSGVPDVDVDPDWDEFDHTGLVSGHGAPPDRREFQRLFEAATARWATGDDAGFTEPWAGFVARVEAAARRAVARAGSGRTVVVVTSGGPIGLTTAGLLDPDDPDPAGLARRWQRLNTVAVNTGVTTVVVGGSGARLLTFNEHGHLDGDLLTYR